MLSVSPVSTNPLLLTVFTYQLLKIPPANVHIPLVLIHALGKRLRRRRAVVAPLVVLSARVLSSLRNRRLGGRRPAKERADCVAEGVSDGGANCDTAGEGVSPYSLASVDGQGRGRTAYAAVVAIWPKRPGPWEAVGAMGAAAAGGAAAGAEGA
jgi:hypothetical protein